MLSNGKWRATYTPAQLLSFLSVFSICLLRLLRTCFEQITIFKVNKIEHLTSLILAVDGVEMKLPFEF